MRDKVIRCRFDLNHEVFPSGFYDVRWFRADDRGKYVEITRERFQFRNHSVGVRRGSVSQTSPKLAPKAVATSEDEVKPGRSKSGGHQWERDQATESGRGPLAIGAKSTAVGHLNTR
jgi:hypothetical protein